MIKRLLSILVAVLAVYTTTRAQDLPYYQGNYKDDVLKHGTINPPNVTHKPGSSEISRRDQNTYNRITIGGQDLFLTGANLAWVIFGEDVGFSRFRNDVVHPNMAQFNAKFDQLASVGANSVRWWLHADGTSSPMYDENNDVSGINAELIPDVKEILDAAWERGLRVQICLWSFDMLKDKSTHNNIDANEKLFDSDAALDLYIEKALIPMVDSLKGHPGLLAWEIFNEPEWMTANGSEPFTLNGFTDRRTSITKIRKFINKCTGAIHRTDTNAIVTVGAVTLKENSDVAGYSNQFTDAKLIEAGGDQDGTLDIYNIHYYENKGREVSPFQTTFPSWELDKPTVVAEFYPNEDFGISSDSTITKIYENNWAGAFFWSLTDRSFDLMESPLQTAFDLYGSDIEIDKDAVEGTFSFTLSATRVCPGDTISIVKVTEGGTTYLWNFGQGASPATFSGMNPPTISYSAGGEKSITLTVDGELASTKVIYVPEVEVNTTVANLEALVIGNCDLSTLSTYGVSLDPSPSSVTTAQAVPVIGWEQPVSQSSFTISSDGSIPGMENAGRFLYGNWQSGVGPSSYSFTGRFGVNATIDVHIKEARTSFGQPKIQIEVDGNEVYNGLLEGVSVETASIPAGEHTVTVNNAADEWFEVQKYVFNNLETEVFEYKWYRNGLLVETTASGTFDMDATDSDELYVTTTVGQNTECSETVINSNTLTTTCVDATGIDGLIDGVNILASPNAGQSFTAGINSTYTIVDQQGRVLFSDNLSEGDIFGESLPYGIYFLSVESVAVRILKY